MDNKQLLEYAQKKYDKGAKEHEDDLWLKPPNQLIQEALDESIDMMFYLNTLLNRLK